MGSRARENEPSGRPDGFLAELEEDREVVPRGVGSLSLGLVFDVETHVSEEGGALFHKERGMREEEEREPGGKHIRCCCGGRGYILYRRCCGGRTWRRRVC